ncbi:caspase family protein [Cyanothece sp. BG0011]|uniref:caspase family protein n=1 Tax=Cyanothece sp. BG0011 TaxID=2082950 RepID=UPI000D1E628B|nr:caspase family protein [Cyanothece sp. BG0011]
MKWDRRTFLQTLLTWGVAQESLTWLNSNRQLKKYYQTLAEPTHRKLALLVGINDYGKGYSLKGCVTDVERQKDLLIHRFGFNPQDILTLTDKEATRQGIETAFIEHLVQQAKAGDVVIFHFSGYGNYVNIPPDIVPTLTKGQLPGIIAQDGITLTQGNPSTNNILEDTLRLLGRSLLTDKVTMVLDTSYHSSGQTVQGHLRVRSFPYPTDTIERDEFTFQADLKQKLPKSKAGSSAGIILSAAKSEQMATEIKGNGFSAGLFTYALTQHLWSTVPASRVNITLNKTTEQILPIMGGQQEPQQENSPSQPLFTYYLLPPVSQGSEAFINSVEDSERADITLTGFPANIVRYYGVNSIFYPVTNQSSSVPLQLRSRNGLKAKVRRLSSQPGDNESLAVGQLLQESVRCLPKTIGLTVALDPQLQRIERVDATSAFSAIDIVSDVMTEGEQPIDCILGLRSSFSTPSSQPQETGTYSLFLPGGVPLPNTLGKSGEAIKSAIERLRPTLEKLLTMKLWGLTLNEGSSQVPWRVTLEGLDPKPYGIVQRQTTRIKTQTPQAETDKNKPITPESNNIPGLPKVPRGTRLRYRLENLGETPLYYLVLGINSSGKAIAYVPPYEEDIEPSEDEQRFIEPGRNDFVPATSTGLTWTTSSTKGWEHILAIAAIAPFQKTLEALKKISEFKTDKDQILTLKNPLEVSKALLEDLETASQQTNSLVEGNPDSYILDVKAWSTLSFMYQVI